MINNASVKHMKALFLLLSRLVIDKSFSYTFYEIA